MRKISLNLHFQDHYDNQVAYGVLEFAKNIPTWEINGQGYWFQHTQEKVDGIIARIENKEELAFYESLNIPIVDIAGAFVSRKISTVRNDDWDTGVKSGEFMVTSGAGNFAVCQVSNVRWAEERTQGFCSGAVIKKQNLPCFSRSLDWWKHLYSPDTPSLDSWLSSLSFPVALFCCNDLCAMKVSVACRRLGIKIPTDVSIMGVDNEEILCMLSKPSITSMALQLKDIGYEAASLLSDIFDRKTQGRFVKRISPLRVVERESTSIVFEKDPLVEKALRFIQQNVRFGIGVNEVTAALPGCRRSVELHFRKAMNMSVFEYIVQKRLEEAERQLLFTDKPIKVVGSECGFGSIQRFHSVFKNKYGTTPYEYRKKLKQGNKF